MALGVLRSARFFFTGGADGPTVNTGVVSNSGSVSVVRVGGDYAVRFNAGRSVVSRVPNLTSSDFTAEVWVRLRADSTERPVLVRRNGSTEVSITVLSDGTVQGVASSASGGYRVNLRSSGRVDDGKWHHVALGCSRGWFGELAFTLWVDGVTMRSGRMSPGLFGVRPDLSMTTDILIGGDGAKYAMGDVLAVAFRDSALSSATVIDHAGYVPEEARAQYGWGVILG